MWKKRAAGGVGGSFGRESAAGSGGENGLRLDQLIADRIVYGSGGVIPSGAIAGRAENLFERDDIAYVHVPPVFCSPEVFRHPKKKPAGMTDGL
ncbi:hypothetical protein [Mesorhizobium sp.]|uniref:hypothetical protein n=1 Tax=Mesorhizobium sp. TaxID=1871066 RepID=UPI00258C2D6F|nr:hypothetical protein [Mesorhizobium sp.]